VDWKFNHPVFAGDTIHTTSEVHEKSLRGRGKRGEIKWHRTVVNQDGKVVQDGYVITLVECRPPSRGAVGAADAASSNGSV
jgi:acyl dehydratase